MQKNRVPQAARYTTQNRRRRVWKKVVGCLACVVVFVTTYALILPAITMEREPICGLEEHTHTEECYASETIAPAPEFLCSAESLTGHVHEKMCYSEDGSLLCGYADFVVHTHNSLCYDESGDLICPLPEIEEHIHTEDCYTEERTLICGEEEDPGHVHTAACYKQLRGELVCTQEEEGHEHGDSCYQWTDELICTEEERDPGHIHDDSCYETEQVLVCEEEEVILHTHGESCFDEGGNLICGRTEVLEHRHTADCMLAPESAPEEVRVLICELEEHTHTEECFPDQEPEPQEPDLEEPGAEEPAPEEPAPEEPVPEESETGISGDETWLCGLTEHTHGEDCYGPEGDLLCELEEHIHTEECLPEAPQLTGEEQARVDEVIALIDALPASEEIDAALTAYEEAEDWESYEGYYLFVGQQTRYAYEQYTALDAELQAQVLNVDKLNDLAWLWSAVTLEAPADAVTVNGQEELKNALENGESCIQLSGNFNISNSLAVPANADITLDLNGHTLTAAESAALFTIPSGATLTIVDSQQETETVEMVSGNLAGNTVSLSGGTLTYYVTTTRVTDSATGATQETLKKHTVSTAGAIAGGSQPVFQVTGGTLNICSGMIRGGTGRAIVQTGGVTNMTGGYICGFTQSSGSTDNTSFGGAIKVSGGTLNLSGTVLAGNTAHNGGAIYATGSTQISIADGVVSGNTANRTTSGWNDHSESGAYRCGGGGIYADGSAEITMSGGYITNNIATHDGYFDGGGGVCLSGTSSMALSGGYVTGNQAQGGGGIRTDFGKGTTFVMTGGFVSSNIATHAEGGGIAIDRNGVGTITGGYITNNKIPNTGHWGGGGLFCADGSTLNLKNTLITENTAGGFGAGVAGCPTGNLYLYVTEGCAIYGNTDTVDGDSPHFTSDGVKQIDKEICTEVFQSNGHADFFCALNSTVTGTMLGGNAANWQGSADYQPVIADAEDLLSATRVMGLTAKPTAAGKSAAQSAAKVYINGNYSYTHGGGIMCNGNLVIGVPVDIEVPARIDLQATKKLIDGSGNAQSLEDNDFSFKVTMTEVDGTVIANGVCDSSGKITFDHQLTYKQEGTFVYYVYEETDGSDPSVTYDSTLYRLTVTVTKDNGVAWYGDTIKYTYSVTSVKVESSADGETWKQVSQSDTSQSGVISLPLTSGTTFTNRRIEPTKITVQKKWEGGSGADSVTVILKRDGEEFDRRTLNADNGWTYTWDNLETGHSYTVEEVEVPGYTASYEITTSTDDSGSTSLGQGSWWVPATELTVGQQYLIVSADGTKALYIASGNEGQGFDTADVTSVVQQQTNLTVNGQTYATWYQAADIPARSIYNAEALTRNSHSGIVLKRSDGGSYPYLRLESNNNNYFKGASSTTYASFLVFDGVCLKGHNASEWTPDNLRTVIYADGKFNTTTEQNPANAVKLYTLVSGEGFTGTVTDSSTVIITNTREASSEYVLPETGGAGTTLYTIGGLLLMAGALLLYKKRPHGKGGRDSPC